MAHCKGEQPVGCAALLPSCNTPSISPRATLAPCCRAPHGVVPIDAALLLPCASLVLPRLMLHLAPNQLPLAQWRTRSPPGPPLTLPVNCPAVLGKREGPGPANPAYTTHDPPCDGGVILAPSPKACSGPGTPAPIEAYYLRGKNGAIGMSGCLLTIALPHPILLAFAPAPPDPLDRVHQSITLN